MIILSCENVKIAFGTDVTVGAYNEEWAYVEHGGRYGFVPVADLSRKEYPELKSGSEGSEVKALEDALLSMGYFDGVPDAKFDALTAQAVERFQTDLTGIGDGVATQRLQRMIFSGNGPKCAILGVSLSKGDIGQEVERIQTRLLCLGYLGDTKSVDGSYGVITAAAISMFQNANDISSTSKADPATIKKLYSTGAAGLPSGKKPADEVIEGGNITDGSQSVNSTTISSTSWK